METHSSSPLPQGDSPAPPAGNASAYLTVHAEPTHLGGRRRRHGLTRLQQLRALCWSSAGPASQAVLSLTLADRHGHTVLSLVDADPVFGIALSPGTYHLTATRGNTRRGYTVALPAGSRLDLHLRFETQELIKSPPPTAPWPARSAS